MKKNSLVFCLIALSVLSLNSWSDVYAPAPPPPHPAITSESESESASAPAPPPPPPAITETEKKILIYPSNITIEERLKLRNFIKNVIGRDTCFVNKNMRCVY